MNYLDIINHYPDFPKKGIDFIDILPFLHEKEAYNELIADIAAHVHCPNVATVEARGFLFAAPLLFTTQTVRNIIPIRKKGKLPFSEGDLHDVKIEKEYGSDHVFYRLSDIAAGVPEGDTFNITLFDDILATGGTARGIAESLNRQKVTVDGKEYQLKITDFVFLVEIDDLPGRSIIETIAPVKALMHVTEN
jgi:adenine phosphoribosyltransferase